MSAKGYLIGTVVVGVVFATPFLWVRCKRQQEEEQIAANARRTAELAKNALPAPVPTEYVIKWADGRIAKSFPTAEACWEEWDGAHALMWEAQKEKGMPTEAMHGCWLGAEQAKRTAPPAESLPEWRESKKRQYERRLEKQTR